MAAQVALKGSQRRISLYVLQFTGSLGRVRDNNSVFVQIRVLAKMTAGKQTDGQASESRCEPIQTSTKWYSHRTTSTGLFLTVMDQKKAQGTHTRQIQYPGETVFSSQGRRLRGAGYLSTRYWYHG